MGGLKYGCRFLVGLVSFILLSVSGASAQGGLWGPGGGGGGTASTCLLNSTGFETTEKLCDPQLPNDSTGWFSKKGADLSGCEMQMQASNAIQTGVPASISSSSAFFTKTNWTKLKGSNNPIDANRNGFTAILKNPKTIDPILSEGNGTNMLVNSGTSGDNLYHFLSYSFSGLEPESFVAVEFDVYYLLDSKSIELYVDYNKLDDYQPFGTGAHYNSNGTPTKLKLQSTQLDLASRMGQDAFTDKQRITVEAKAGAQSQRKTFQVLPDGSLTIYFTRVSQYSTIPIGIDNIKVYADVQPSISYTGTACPEMPASLITRESYPAGTKYSWKVSSPDTTGTEESFVFYPHKENTDYTAQVQVTLPGCAASDLVKTTIHVGTCCLSDDGAPAALANVYYNDFGYFSGKNYIYTDAMGKEQSVAAPDVNYCAPYDGQPVTSDPRKDFTGVRYASNICSGGGNYAISTIDPYTGILRDHTGKKNGAFLMIDLDGTAGGSGWKNPVFEKEICGLCHDKMIRFNTAVSAINNAMGGATACDITISLVDKKTGNPLKLYDKNTGQPMKDCVWTHRSNTPGWKNFPDEADYELYLKEEDDIDCVILRIEYNSNKAEKDEGDFALDDIFFQVCAPPAITIDYDVNGSHQVGDVLDLCQDVLRVKTNDRNGTLARYYGKDDVRYMFQYTDQNPNKTDPSKVIWRTMKDANGKEILKDSVYVIDDPQHHEAFEKFVQNPGLKDSVYFRILVGKEVTLGSSIEIERAISENSPCRNISVQFLDIPAMLNCEACTKPDHVHIEADGKSKKTVELCKGESTILEVKNKNGKNQLHGIEVNTSKDYYEYEATWLKDGNPISGKFKATSETDPSTPTLEVTWDDVQAAGSAEYSMLIHDAYDPTLTSTYCDTTVTITVIAHPDPEAPTIDDIDLCEKVKPRKELKDRLKENDFSDFTVNWYDGANTQTASKVSEPDLDALTATSTFYYSVTDKSTLCEGDTKSFEVEVHSTSNPLGTMKVSYLVKDTTSSGVFKDLLSQDASAVQTESGYTYIWFDKNQKLYKGDGKSVPVPDVPSLPLTDDVHETYYVARYDNTYGCWSDTLPVEVTIFGAPAPIPEDVYYCVGSSRVVPLTAEINDPNGVGTANFKLVWYDPDKKLIGDDAPTPSVSKEGETIYFVSQKSNDGAESSLQPLSVKVYKAHQLSPVSPDTYCDEEQNPNALVKAAEEGPNDYEQATDIQWYLYGDPWDKDKRPVLGIKKDTTYVFGAVQSYAVTTSTGVELETCYSDTTYYTVKVQYTPPTGDSSVAYIAAEVGSDNKTFPAITTKDGWSEEPGYTYYYSEAGKNNYSTSVPKPVYDVSNLNGGTTEIQYDVYRIKDGTNCPSEVKTITVSISDAMPPKVKDYHYCEGSELQPISAEIRPISGKTENSYELYWYTSKPSNTTVTPEKTGTTYSLSGTAAVESDGSIKSTTYYVAQHDVETGATSAAVEIHVVVYPKPILTITDPAATCGSDNKFVDITGTWKASNTNETVTPTYSADVPTAVEESGVYKIKGEYNIPSKAYKGGNIVEVMDDVCEGDEFPVNVEVNYLTVPTIGDQTGVCPGKDIKLTASATSTDPGTDKIKYQWSGHSTQTGSTATAVGDMTTGTNHLFKVTATVGVCEFTSSDYYVKVGDGPVVGNIEISETDNSELPRTLDAFSGDLDSRTLYSCGGEVVVKSNLSKTEGDFEWYDGNTKIHTGDVLTIDATDKYSEKTYTIKYINECETQTNFRIVTVPLSVEYVGPDTTVVLCQGEVFETQVNVKCQETTPMIQWYRNTTPVGEKKTASTTTVNNYGIGSVEKTDDGRYNCVVTNRGCTAKTNADSLVVHPNVIATLAEGPHVVARHDSKTLALNISVPVDGKLSDIVWKRDGVEVQSGSSPEYTEMDVVADHDYYVTLNDPEYCGTSAISTIWVDAELQLTTELKDTICLGEGEQLRIDTTGTGKFRANNPVELKVLVEMGGNTQDISKALKRDGDILIIDVSPTSDATYMIDFTYGSQHKSSVENVHVIPAISLDLPDPVTICEGEQTDLTVQNVAPVGTTVSWYADETILSATSDSMTVTVQPTYSAETGERHESVYTYVVIAYNRTCQTFKEYKVPVNVDEPITGEMEGVGVICDGEESYVDAHNYAATTYQWTTSDGDTLNDTERIMSLRPSHSTIYYADMTRGMCKAKESFTVEVKSLPVIASIDSVGYHSREVTLESGTGNAPFSIWYDNIPATADNVTHFDNIPFGTHTMHVKDFYNCETSMIFHLDPPEIFIPEYFSPNNDGTNDRWIIPGLSELYPASVVSIYDRYGKLVAQFFGANSDGWDGTYNGEKMPSTDYWYQIDIEEINRQYVGHFTLIRR
ncbi:MAG: T9SS type B sorting domain-containing protein [Paludibacteraceae bacterium]|nr:T9SS type B sorting domain-containing protein [Paludibacteraceae bacterium]